MRTRSVAAICFTVGALLVGLFAYRVTVKHRAISLLATAEQVASSNDPNSAFGDVQRRHGNRLTKVEDCTTAYCAYEISVSNRLLAALHLAPRTELTLRFNVVRGRVRDSLLVYRATLRNGASPTIHVQTDYCNDCGYVFLHPWSNFSDDSDNGLVQIGAKASADMHKIAMSVNPDCLTNFYGCRDIAGLLPTVWQRTANGKTMCRVHNRTGQVDW